MLSLSVSNDLSLSFSLSSFLSISLTIYLSIDLFIYLYLHLKVAILNPRKVDWTNYFLFIFPEALRRVLLLKAAANFTCQLLMPTCRELLHLPTSHANLSRVTFTCQLLMPTCRELLHLPTSHANLSRVTSRAYFSCQLVESYFTCLLLMSTF